jgi:hypothetical protein
MNLNEGNQFHDFRTGHEETNRRCSDTKAGVLWVVVPYTTPELTRAALRHAAACSDLDIHVYLVDVQVVPSPLDEPPIQHEFSEHRLCELLKESRLPGKSAVVYARNRLEGFTKLLEPDSLVILATKKHWWPTHEEKLARFNESETK